MLNKYFTAKNCCIILGIGLLMSIIPLLGMAQYAYPASDDFYYGYATHEAWVETRSLIEVAKAGIRDAAENYQGWQGTFFACFLMTLQPGIFGTQYYQIVPYILILTLVIATILFCYTIFRRVLRGNPYCAFSLAFILLLYSIQLVPYPGQSFYWYNGAIYYTFSHSLSLIMFSCLLLSYTNKALSLKVVFLSLASILAICVGGSNYTTALLSAAVLCMVLAYVAAKKIDGWWTGLFPALLCITCLAISVFAPGNNVRRLQYQDTSLIKALYISFLQAGQKIIEWINLPWLILIAVSFPFVWVIVKNLKMTFRYPLLFIAGIFCCFSICFFPTAYTAEGALYDRNIDILFYVFAMLSIICLFYTVGWITNQNDMLDKLMDIVRPRPTIFAMLALVVSMMYLWPGIGPQNATGTSALHSLASGEAQAFGKLMDERFVLLNNHDLAFVYVPAKSVRPWVLPQEEVTQDPEHWINVGMALYYHKEAIYIVWQ